MKEVCQPNCQENIIGRNRMGGKPTERVEWEVDQRL